MVHDGDITRLGAGRTFLYEGAPSSMVRRLLQTSALHSNGFFTGDKLELNKALIFVYSWSRGYTTMAFCSRKLGMSSNCAVGETSPRSSRRVAAQGPSCDRRSRTHRRG
uniref:Uncharacterized protein n=1 Tax=Trichuris muris TaxID=70415 RepID=A0A5S6QQ45_TRIMR